ncbi:MAG: hypothetical protein U0V18_10625 [Anaerolineales bacterium]
MLHEIDFSLLPDLSSSKIRYALDENIVACLYKFPLVLERAENAVRFCWFVTSLESVLSLNEPETTRLRQGFLRAALAEFVSMKDVLKQEVESQNIQKEIISITDSKNPLLHIIHELRNFEIHLHSGELNPDKIPAKFNRKTEPEIWHDIELSIWAIDELTTDKFSKLRNIKKYYNQNDLKKMVEWFNSAQSQWGVHYLIFLAVEYFCDEVIHFYSLGNS